MAVPSVLTRYQLTRLFSIVSVLYVEMGRGDELRGPGDLHRGDPGQLGAGAVGAVLGWPPSRPGGAIPETGDYRVLMEAGRCVDRRAGAEVRIRRIESTPGDVFLLGTDPWQVVQVTNGVMRVRYAAGTHLTVPFWLGEAPGRTDELSEEVSRLRRGVAERLDGGWWEVAIGFVR